jgi:hypothetical protein
VWPQNILSESTDLAADCGGGRAVYHPGQPSSPERDAVLTTPLPVVSSWCPSPAISLGLDTPYPQLAVVPCRRNVASLTVTCVNVEGFPSLPSNSNP